MSSAWQHEPNGKQRSADACNNNSNLGAIVAATSRRGVSSNNVLTQDCLAAYRCLLDERQRLDEEYKHQRANILALLEAGANVEPGPLTVEVQRVEKRPLTRASVTAALGADYCEQLLECIQPIEQKKLYVKPAAGTNTAIKSVVNSTKPKESKKAVETKMRNVKPAMGASSGTAKVVECGMRVPRNRSSRR